uniref:RRM domain-containing protein n=1 Tax=Percolomonas cosmopolitus TaxID=63605 RepID=A0A7S1KTZ5_9EUKA|mmetsp:Transcript_958/g.3284  ORF Transcript_958/g.3284 Transcript_958/m.3284 type:complete len:577 (+) Transcript_958:951-2681(+)
MPAQSSASNGSKPATSTTTSQNQQSHTNSASAKLAPEQERTIHIANLSPSVSKRALYIDFIQFGKITNLRIAGKEEYSTRFAFVEFELVEDALKAMEAMQSSVFDGKRISISRAKSKIHTPFDLESLDLEGKKVPLDSTQRFQPPSQKFRSMGQNNAAGPSPHHSGQQAQQQSQSQQPVTGDASRTIYIANIDISLPDESLINFFHGNNIGYVTNHRICRVKDKAKSKRPQQTKFAFVEFATRDQAKKAVSFSGQMIGKFAVNISHSKTGIYAPPSAGGNNNTMHGPQSTNPLAQNSMARVTQQQGGVNIPPLSSSSSSAMAPNLYPTPQNAQQPPSLVVPAHHQQQGGGSTGRKVHPSDPRLVASTPTSASSNSYRSPPPQTYDHTNYYFGSPNGGGSYGYGDSYYQQQQQQGGGYANQQQQQQQYGYGSQSGYGMGQQAYGSYGSSSLPSSNVWSTQNAYSTGSSYGSYSAYGAGGGGNSWDTSQQSSTSSNGGGGYGVSLGGYGQYNQQQYSQPAPSLTQNPSLPTNGMGALPLGAGKRKRSDIIEEESRVGQAKRSRSGTEQVWNQGGQGFY